MQVRLGEGVCCLWLGGEVEGGSAIEAFQKTLVGQRGGQHAVALRLDLAHTLLALVDVALGVIVHVQAQGGERDADGLHWVYWLVEPHNREADDGDTLDERGDRVRDGRRRREEGKGEEDLRKVHRAVDEEVENDLCARHSCGGVDDLDDASAKPQAHKSSGVRVDPHWHHEEEGHAAREVQEVDLIEAG